MFFFPVHPKTLSTTGNVQNPQKTQKLQMTLFEAEQDPLTQELALIDVNMLTPMEALKKLDEWKRRLSQPPNSVESIH